MDYSSSTSSCITTSYSYPGMGPYYVVTNATGYQYFTTFYGEIHSGTSSRTSWVYSACDSTGTGCNENGLTITYETTTDKKFGDIYNSTTISQRTESLLILTNTETFISNVVSTLSTFTRKEMSYPYETRYTTSISFYSTSHDRTYTGPYFVIYENNWYNTDIQISLESHAILHTYQSSSSSSETTFSINTSAYGGNTYRLSDLMSSYTSIRLGNSNLTIDYAYSYSVSSVYNFNNVDYTLNEYTTALYTSYTGAYSVRTDNPSYSVTNSTSWAVVSTGSRFIDRVELSVSYSSTYTGLAFISVYNDSTISSSNSWFNLSSSTMQRDSSTVSQTFISSSADISSTTSIVDSSTSSTFNGSFINSMRELVATTTEQQNDTLIFASTFNTYSYYNSTYITSTINTVGVTEEATTYTEWYNPISWSHTYTSVATSSSATETVQSSSGSVSVTQSIDYTPVYTSTDGVYLTA